MMDRYFLAALIVGGLVAVSGGVAGLYRRRGVPPADVEVREELVRQGIAATAVPVITAQEREQAELTEMRAMYLRQQAALNVGMQNLAAAGVLASQRLADSRAQAQATRQAAAREITVHHLLQDPEPSAEAIALAGLVIRRARAPHPPLQ